MPTSMSEWHQFLTYFPLDKANWNFKASQNLTAPLILYYSGVLPATPSLRHLLLVSQLKGTNTDSFGNQSMPRPQMFDHGASHDFTMLYAHVAAPQRRDLLFHFQISGSDITAKQLAYFFIEACGKAEDNDQIYLSDRRHRNFWADLARTKLSQLNVDSSIWEDNQSLQVV
ncbi:hypothetical protein [Synechocystis salina]|uniref:Uncharacterized protein n=1 Tax=Synechocystis salina LEGE 00031 TaxID=1828736 RepID=A0ABR9VM02_9SYNC|nr:hypothetical protein [Synechocystis salina]MBE9239458.1 hypothetical protein [Synechocystis salina LEGE 00041]MBE9252370.1 hypothetical protein [Synechocystis salina LEGE 00031]